MNWRDTPATTAIAAATIAISALISLAGLDAYAALFAGFIPILASGVAMPPEMGWTIPWWLTPLSATLVHAGFIHLALNMVMLVYCGRLTEQVLGSKALVVLYLVGAYAAAFGQWMQGPNTPVPMVGASGAISAVLAAYALLYGQRRARAIGPVPADIVHALWLGAAWIGIQLLTGIAGLGGPMRIAIGAHIGGFLVGLVLMRPLLLWRYRGA
jgi:membrane associated rhomboid family serine protease